MVHQTWTANNVLFLIIIVVFVHRNKRKGDLNVLDQQLLYDGVKVETEWFGRCYVCECCCLTVEIAVCSYTQHVLS